MTNDINLEQDDEQGEQLINQLDDELKKPFRELLGKEREARMKLEEEIKRRDSVIQKETFQTQVKNDDIEAVLRLQVEGHSTEEVLHLRTYARKMGIPIDEVAKDPIIKAGLEVVKQKAKAVQGTPAPSNRVNPIVDNRPWEALTPKERSDNIGNAFEQAMNRGNKSNE